MCIYIDQYFFVKKQKILLPKFTGTTVEDMPYNFENSFCDNKKNVFDKNVVIMEVKSNNNLPLNMCTLFNDLHLFPTSFSKVGEVYKKTLLEKEL